MNMNFSQLKKINVFIVDKNQNIILIILIIKIIEKKDLIKLNINSNDNIEKNDIYKNDFDNNIVLEGNIEKNIEKNEEIIKKLKNKGKIATCKIIEKNQGSGFFCKISYLNKTIKILFTNNHI